MRVERVKQGGVAAVLWLAAWTAQAEAPPEGREIVAQCGYKNPGLDQRSKLTIILRDKDGNERTSIYLRLWKDYKGDGNIVDKMVLFTESPADARGAGFMRWAFTQEAGKNADQWIYLPVLQKTRRVSIRDPGDSFLGSDLTYADISGRSLDQDEHKLVKIENRDGADFYVVESTPKEDDYLYSKRVAWYSKSADWEGCVNVGMIYYDKKGQLLKKQSLTWQKVKDAWLWKKVEVQNVQTKHASIFEVNNAEINVGLDDDVFQERTLAKGYKPK
ncbi:MAG: hypothetical protein FD130_731 [Halothiobacillaceae bacterium]|nr:MAG: hypothetical protein FD130_731 [Halothiobacillaceae bacterium]